MVLTNHVGEAPYYGRKTIVNISKGGNKMEIGTMAQAASNNRIDNELNIDWSKSPVLPEERLLSEVTANHDYNRTLYKGITNVFAAYDSFIRKYNAGVLESINNPYYIDEHEEFWFLYDISSKTLSAIKQNEDSFKDSAQDELIEDSCCFGPAIRTDRLRTHTHVLMKHGIIPFSIDALKCKEFSSKEEFADEITKIIQVYDAEFIKALKQAIDTGKAIAFPTNYVGDNTDGALLIHSDKTMDSGFIAQADKELNIGTIYDIKGMDITGDCEIFFPSDEFLSYFEFSLNLNPKHWGKSSNTKANKSITNTKPASSLMRAIAITLPPVLILTHIFMRAFIQFIK